MRLLLFSPLVFLSACASPQSRVRSALIDAGLPRNVSTCMAQRMVDRLSLAQLQRLSRLSAVRGERIGAVSVGELVRRARVLGDPETLTVLTTAGLGCAIAS